MVLLEYLSITMMIYLFIYTPTFLFREEVYNHIDRTYVAIPDHPPPNFFAQLGYVKGFVLFEVFLQ